MSGAMSAPTGTVLPIQPTADAASEASAATPAWARLLAQEAARLLAEGTPDTASFPDAAAGTAMPPGVMERLTRVFEATLIRTALEHTRGRRVEAALRLGIGRNTITRKIQELGLDD